MRRWRTRALTGRGTLRQPVSCKQRRFRRPAPVRHRNDAGKLFSAGLADIGGAGVVEGAGIVASETAAGGAIAPGTTALIVAIEGGGPARLLTSLAVTREPGGGAMSTQPEVPTPDTPQILLEHHLKALRLPTILREYDKLARQCA